LREDRKTVAWWGCLSAIAGVDLLLDSHLLPGRRWRKGRAAGEVHLSLREGLTDVLRRRVVTREWAIWRPEVAWLTGYFSFAVWVSLALVHFPRG